MARHAPRAAATLAAATIALLAVSACGSELTHGTITGKRYMPASSHLVWLPTYSERCTTRYTTVSTKRGSSTRSYRSCSEYRTGTRAEIMYDPDCYELRLRQGSETGAVCVAETEYATAKIGGTW